MVQDLVFFAKVATQQMKFNLDNHKLYNTAGTDSMAFWFYIMHGIKKQHKLNRNDLTITGDNAAMINI